MPTFAAWVSLPENRSALAAVERVADCVCGRSGGTKPPARLAFNGLSVAAVRPSPGLAERGDPVCLKLPLGSVRFRKSDLK